ncbi:C-C motif chemokine 19a.1 isoform X2 [Danio rerio]|uniref:C-C motif chemokine 19a.1 isoform X2 n=1 Tax=Danio rerio TaxID=7955 RepID=A0AC58JL22_DANRE
MHRAAQRWNHELVRAWETSDDPGSDLPFAHSRRNKQNKSPYNDLSTYCLLTASITVWREGSSHSYAMSSYYTANMLPRLRTDKTKLVLHAPMVCWKLQDQTCFPFGNFRKGQAFSHSETLECV